MGELLGKVAGCFPRRQRRQNAADMAGGEHRELAGIPGDVVYATRPQLVGELLERAHERGVCAAFVTGDEVYGGPHRQFSRTRSACRP